jgi:hypothetical protein
MPGKLSTRENGGDSPPRREGAGYPANLEYWGNNVMMVSRVVKVPGGKLLKLAVEVEDGILRSVSLRGDFFAHPEEGFDRAEASLAGIPADRFEASFRSALEREGVELYGISAAAAAAAFNEVYREIAAD